MKSVVMKPLVIKPLFLVVFASIVHATLEEYAPAKENAFPLRVSTDAALEPKFHNHQGPLLLLPADFPSTTRLSNTSLNLGSARSTLV
jgi:hypothetical protein